MALARDTWSLTASAANALATAQKAAAAGKTHYLTSISVSYGAAAAAGLLQIKDGLTGGAVIWERYLKDTLPYDMTFDPPLKASPGNAFTLELAAGGAGSIGKVNTVGWTD